MKQWCLIVESQNIDYVVLTQPTILEIKYDIDVKDDKCHFKVNTVQHQLLIAIFHKILSIVDVKIN